MLDSFPIYPSVPAQDIDRARRFYEEVLGFTPAEHVSGGVIYRSGTTMFLLYPTPAAGTAQHTLAFWETDDIERTMAELRGRGVTFEEYDFPGLKTVNGIADLEGERSAWFRDSEGNILAIGQRT
jgi:catechol 2,3-dioxygenase-like lactoylglutathione lyase family enzyme